MSFCWKDLFYECIFIQMYLTVCQIWWHEKIKCNVHAYRWSELQVWPQGALVKHVRGLFKADGVNVTAEPGNSMHARFYVSMLFWGSQVLVAAFVWVCISQSRATKPVFTLNMWWITCSVKRTERQSGTLTERNGLVSGCHVGSAKTDD